MLGRHRFYSLNPMSFSSSVSKFNALPGNLKGALTLMVAALGFALMAALVKLAGERLHVTQILLVRQIIMIAIVMPRVLTHFPGCLRTQRLDLQIIRVCAALVAMLAGFYAIINMPLADAMAIGFAKAFFVTIFAIIILHEKVGWRRWAAVAVGFIGVMVMIQPGTANFNPISLYALVGSAAAGFVMVIIRKLSETDAPITTLSYQAFLVGLAVVIPGVIYWQAPTANEWFTLLAIGAVSYGAQMANIYSYKWGEASVLASLDYVRLLYATLFGYLLFETLPTVYTWIGAAVIIAASLYTVQRERSKAKAVVIEAKKNAEQ
ncbi:DMT family transporter [Pseudahrensia aquimaris]|uniref:DMT family transporter n=1 Tax=Pseudahrensia aquimaris TaxID=744461 RepID=A0ABW3FBL8_9HYPH